MVETNLGLPLIKRIVIDFAYAPFDTPDGTFCSPKRRNSDETPRSKDD
tara:strand:- start:172 stop:315 length:144 start_codon:yes stop_codon:yes gene_type:complete